MTYDLPRDCDLNPGDFSDSSRRMGTDRRREPTGPPDAFRRAGRRARVRRGAERQGSYFLDRFDAFTLALIVTLLGLTIVDGVLTIELLDVNSEEFNPLMNHLLTRGHTAFLLGKYILTAAGLPFLLVYKNYRMFGTRFRVGFLFPIFLSLYLALVAYQVHLLQIGQSGLTFPGYPERQPQARLSPTSHLW
jgi:hypothetical protein